MTTVRISAGPRADWAFDNATLANAGSSRSRDAAGNVVLTFSATDSPHVLAFWQAYAAQEP